MTAGDAVPVLMYHEIATATDTASRLAVPPGLFAAQLRYLHDQGFTTLTAGVAAAALAGGSHRLPTRSIVLTFDDGFADFHREALPVLLQYGFTATLFVTTGWVQDACRFSADQRPGRMLTWSQIAEIASAGVEIGAHSQRHLQLDQLPGRRLRPELRDSRAQLEDRLGRQVPGMAYPFGYSDARVRQAVREAGHQYAYAVGNVIARTGADPFALPRLTIRRSTSPAAFADIANGRNLWPLFRKDRTLTKGWAVVRRTRSLAGRAVHGRSGCAHHGTPRSVNRSPRSTLLAVVAVPGRAPLPARQPAVPQRLCADGQHGGDGGAGAVLLAAGGAPVPPGRRWPCLGRLRGDEPARRDSRAQLPGRAHPLHPQATGPGR